MSENLDLEKLKYPIGKFEHDGPIDKATVDAWINQIANLPSKLRLAVEGLTDAQLNTPYRENGWTCKQVIHHIGDSHLNSIMRFKLTLTEDTPTIRPYNEALWAETKDYLDYSIEDSLNFIDQLHKKFTVLLRSLTDQDLERKFYHPESKEYVELKRNIGIYAWHGNHHVMHITALRNRKSW